MSSEAVGVRDEVLSFWFGEGDDVWEAPEEKRSVWFGGGAELDAEIKARFGSAIERAARGEYDELRGDPRGELALVLLWDQFTRNVWRGEARAFAYDERAREVCDAMLESGRDRALRAVERVFVYMPLEHHESMASQRRVVALMRELAAEAPSSARPLYDGFATYAEKHAEVIERFGRFPHRNEALGRESTPEERAYLEGGASRFGQ